MAKYFLEKEVMKAFIEAQKKLDKAKTPLPHMCYLDGHMYKLTWKRVKS